jgi:transposase-like protein|tara:strand:+ start:146 stop:652 length:507 start_codon:yes stop_codon:yes gene_type:complete
MSEKTIVTERQRLIMRYRRQGMTVSEIAESLDSSASAISSALETAYRALHVEDEAAVARQMDLERLDELHQSYWDPAKDGDIKAAEFILKTMDRRAKMLGIDAPIETKTDGNLQIGWITDGAFGEIIDHENNDTVSTQALAEDTSRTVSEVCGDSVSPEIRENSMVDK